MLTIEHNVHISRFPLPENVLNTQCLIAIRTCTFFQKRENCLNFNGFKCKKARNNLIENLCRGIYFFYSRQNKLRRISRKQRVEIRDSTIQYCMNKNHSKTTYFKVLCTRYLIFSTMYSAKKNHKLILLFAKSSS